MPYLIQVKSQNIFVCFFFNIGPDLGHKIQRSPTSHRSFSSGNFPNSIFFDTASENEIIEICLNFRSKTAAGYDNVSLDLVKDCIYLFSRPLTHFILCFHPRGQHLCKFIGTKESVYIRKEFNSHRTGLGHEYGRHDVMWKHTMFVPDQLKIARVIPLFKSGDESTFTNYRPVSVLPAFSKILQRVRPGSDAGLFMSQT